VLYNDCILAVDFELFFSLPIAVLTVLALFSLLFNCPGRCFTTLFWYLFVLILELMDLFDCTCLLRAVFSTFSFTVRSYCIVICMF